MIGVVSLIFPAALCQRGRSNECAGAISFTMYVCDGATTVQNIHVSIAEGLSHIGALVSLK